MQKQYLLFLALIIALFSMTSCGSALTTTTPTVKYPILQPYYYGTEVEDGTPIPMQLSDMTNAQGKVHGCFNTNTHSIECGEDFVGTWSTRGILTFSLIPPLDTVLATYTGTLQPDGSISGTTTYQTPQYGPYTWHVYPGKDPQA